MSNFIIIFHQTNTYQCVISIAGAGGFVKVHNQAIYGIKGLNLQKKSPSMPKFSGEKKTGIKKRQSSMIMEVFEYYFIAIG